MLKKSNESFKQLHEIENLKDKLLEVIITLELNARATDDDLEETWENFKEASMLCKLALDFYIKDKEK